MLIIALVLALIGLVALVFAVVTSNELVAWVCIGASVLGVLLLMIDAVRERQRGDSGGNDDDADDDADEPGGQDESDGSDEVGEAVDYPEEADAGDTGADEPSPAPQESAVAGDEAAE